MLKHSNVQSIIAIAFLFFLIFISVLAWHGKCRTTMTPIHLTLKAERPFKLQVFFDESDKCAFAEDKSCFADVFPGLNNLYIKIPTGKVKSLRIDEGSNPGLVTLLNGKIGSMPLPGWQLWNYGADIDSYKFAECDGCEAVELRSHNIDPNLSIVLPELCFGYRVWNMHWIVGVVVLYIAIGYFLWNVVKFDSGVLEFCAGKRFCGLNVIEWFFLIGCMLFYSLWIEAPFNYAPDEAMRYDVTRFFYEHGVLPVNEETINSYWGFSYAHLPTMLCNVCGGILMMIASVFSRDDIFLLHAARFVSVISGVGVVYWVIRTSRYIFHTPARWMFIVMIGMLPQFAFVSSYVNNDILALLGISMIFYSWVSGLMDGWTVRRTFILSIGMAICATAYYNSYSWILMSMIVFPVVYLCHMPRNYSSMVRTGICIALITLVFSAYLFARHIWLYGDLLGFNTAHHFAQLYSTGRPDGMHATLISEGVTLRHMLIDYRWLEVTALSFIGYFGYMAYPLPNWCYRVYSFLFSIGACGLLLYIVGWIRGRRKLNIGGLSIVFAMLCCIVITIVLSVVYSYTRDFQPQGRYCFPALIPIVVFVCKGLEALLNMVIRKECHGGIVLIATSVLLFVAAEGYTVMRATF